MIRKAQRWLCQEKTNIDYSFYKYSQKRGSLMDNIDNENKHINPLHIKIEISLQDKDFPGCSIIRDPACGKGNYIRLFSSKENKKDKNYCKVNLLILKDSKINVILEIEESGITPIKIFGKFLASALSSNYIYMNDNFDMAKSATFIQILDTSGMKDKSSKQLQFTNIEKSIQNIIPINQSNINQYKLFFGDYSDFNQDKIKEIICYINEAINERDS